MAPGNSRNKGARTDRKARGDIRLGILKLIKLNGSIQIGEVAKHLHITHEGARKQMILMEKMGWIARNGRVTESAEIGRPKDFFRVTPEGDRLFPKSYDKLSLAILSALKAGDGNETVRKILSILARNQADTWAPRLEGKTPKQKLNALRALYAEEDPFMSVEMRDGDLILIERNCPFLDVALGHPALCSLTVSTLEMLFGLPVVREEKFQAGHGRCAFRIRTGNPLRKPEFHFETEAATDSGSRTAAKSTSVA